MPIPKSFTENLLELTQTLATLYPQLGHKITLQPISEGIQNYNALLSISRDSSPSHFVTVMRFGQGEITDKGHQELLLELQKQLKERGVLVPEPLPGNNQLLLQQIPADFKGDIGGSFVVLYNFMPGKSVKVSEASLADFTAMGELHGKFLKEGAAIVEARRQAGAPLPENPVSLTALKEMVLSTLGFEKKAHIPTLIQALRTPNSPEAQSLDRKIRTLEEKLTTENNDLVKAFVDKVRSGWAEEVLLAYEKACATWSDKKFDRLPQTLLHNDLHLGNVFIRESRAIFDLGWMGVGTRLCDICQPMVLNCFEVKNNKSVFSVEKQRAYLEGLQKHITLTQQEKAAMRDMVEIMHLRSTATRLVSMMESNALSHITKSPVELTERMKEYNVQQGISAKL